MPALTPKKIGLLIMACFGIIGLVVLAGCGGNDTPVEQHESQKPAAAEEPAAPAPAAEQAPSAANAAPAAAEAPDTTPAAALYTAHCYSGASNVLSYQNLTEDNFESDNGGWKFTGIDGHKTT